MLPPTTAGVDEELVERLRAAAAVVLPEEPVLVAYLFGSRARGTARAGSDVDVAVRLADADDRLGVQLRLTRLLAHRSGVPDLDLVVLDGAPLPLRGRVVQEGRVLYSADEPARIEYESRTAREFFDFSPFIAPLDRELLAQHARGER